MGEPITRLNPKIESRISKILFLKSLSLIHGIAMKFEVKEYCGNGRRPYDYRMLITLCLFRIVCCETYYYYEVKMRTDPRLLDYFGLTILPSKSTLQRCSSEMHAILLRKIHSLLIEDWILRKCNILLDASGIRIFGRSIWYCIRAKKPISRRECDKIHIAICSDTHVILNWFISEGKKADCPYFKWLLLPFENVGIVCADPGYLSRENFEIVLEKLGSLFIPFKKNSMGRSMGSWMWKTSFWLWKKANSLYMRIYHQRSKVECVFSALKKRYGDKLNCKSESSRRNEMAMRFIAYNIRVIIHYQYAVENGLNLFVRAK